MSLNYSKLSQDLSSYTNTHSDIQWYPGVDVTNYAWSKRLAVKRQMDEFCTFMFGGCDAWENFGAFIITSKRGDLQFYNGPSYTNQYSTPQFSNAVGNLLGVNFKQQTISFKVGLYYFTTADYQLFLDYLSPYKIDYLSFGFAEKWSYLVKPTSIQNSPRYVLDRISTEDGEQYYYYTEFTLNFEVQGTPCAQYIDAYQWTSNISNQIVTYTCDSSNRPTASLLDTPFEINIPLYLNDSNPSIQATFSYENTGLSYRLFDIHFEDLAITNIGLFAGTIDSTLNLTIKDGGRYEWRFTNPQGQEEPSLIYVTVTDFDAPRQPVVLTWKTVDNVRQASFYVYDPATAPYNGIGLDQNILPYINNSTLNLRYDSESGLLFLMLGDSTLKLLSLTTSTVTGTNLVNTLYSQKYMIPGTITNRALNNCNWTIQLTVSGIDTSTSEDWNNIITCRARTNVI